MVNESMGRRVNVFFQQHKVLTVILGQSKPKYTNLCSRFLELITAPNWIHVSPKLVPTETTLLGT